MTSAPHAPVLAPAQTSPLAGLYVVITQAAEQSTAISQLLRERGATPIFYPCIDFAPPHDIDALDAAIQHAVADKFDWLIVPSTTSVDALAERMALAGLTGLDLAGLRVAAVGPRVAQAVTERLGLVVKVIPEDTIDTDLAAILTIRPGQRVFLPQSAQTKTNLANGLMVAGADVTVVTAYRPVLAEGGDDVPTQLWRGRIDAITFANPATIRYFRKRLDIMGGNLSMLQDVVVACMDSATADAARQYGLRVRVLPDMGTVEGLVEALARYFGGQS
jgi:uroporphyrinogen-III synthase